MARVRSGRGKVKMTNVLQIGLLCLMTFAPSGALGSAETAFEIFKGLQGNWAIQAMGKTLPIEMSYQVGSKGSILTEHFGKELSVFYREGPSLIMIHFCNAGNQPHLRLKESNQPGLFEFE